MSYSRRQLEAFGEPLGDSATRKEAGRIIYGGGGGGSSPPATQTQVSDLPDWAKPYAQKALAGAEALTFQKDAEGNITGLQPYQAYTGERTAQFTPLQKQAFESAGNLAFSPSQFQAAGVDAGTAGDVSGMLKNAPTAVASQFKGPADVRAMALRDFEMGPVADISTRSIMDQSGGVERYMSPYMQNVVDVQTQQAKRQADIAAQIQQAQAARSGAFGGGRDAIMRAQSAAELQRNLQGIQALGSQQAYQQALGQYNTEQQQALQAAMANQQAGLTVGSQNLAAKLGVQQLGAQTGLQAALANQQTQYNTALQNAQLAQQVALANQAMKGQYGLTGAQLTNQANIANAANQTQASIAAAQNAMQAQQLAEQSKQFGANFGLQSLGVQNQLGTQQQQQIQNIQNQQYQDFLNQQKYPYQQVEFLSNMVRGTPTGQVQSMYQAPPSAASQAIGLGTAALGVSKLYGLKKGGKVDADGGLAKLAMMKITEGAA